MGQEGTIIRNIMCICFLNQHSSWIPDAILSLTSAKLSLKEHFSIVQCLAILRDQSHCSSSKHLLFTDEAVSV